MAQQDADIIIYIEGSNEFYTVRYEVRSEIDATILVNIETRMRKSFSLGRNFADAYTVPSILRKAELMSTIFRNEFGLTAEIVVLVID